MESKTNSLSVYNSFQNLDEDLIVAFEKEFETKVDYDVYDRKEEYYEKISSGMSEYDVVNIGLSAVPELQTFLQKLKHKQIPNLKHLDDKFLNNPRDPGCKYCIPYTWGTTGFGWNSEKVVPSFSTLDQIFNPASLLGKYKGRISMLDSDREALGLALKYVGYSFNDYSHTALEDAKEVLLVQKHYLAGYMMATDYNPMLVSGDMLICHAWNGDVYLAKQKNPAIDYTISEEGGSLWGDVWVIPKGVKHPESAYDWVNYMLRPEVAARNSSFTWYASTNKNATPFIAPDIRKQLYPPTEIFERLEWFEPVTPKVNQRIVDVWAEVQSHT